MKADHAMRHYRETRDYWRCARAGKAAWLIDADAYFRALRAALDMAQRQILILGWDIDSRLRLERRAGQDRSGQPLAEILGDLLERSPDLEIYILCWDYASVFAAEREWFSSLRFETAAPDRLHFCLDNQHTPGASHHQKVVVIDDELAFSGGLDLTRARWDTPDHSPEDSRRRTPDGDSFGPFHDIQAMVNGAAAALLGDLARKRWLACAGEDLSRPDRPDSERWPEGIDAPLQDIDVAIARTRGADIEMPEITEVEQSYLRSISHASRYIYLENQYFTSSTITEALRDRLREDAGPEIVMVLPFEASGWLEEQTMGAIRRHLLERLEQADVHDRLRVFYPGRSDLHDQYINVHSKILVVDDEVLRIGSANLSARSMGLDTECDLLFIASNDQHQQKIRRFVAELVGEHSGWLPGQVLEQWRQEESLIAACERNSGGVRQLLRLAAEDSGPDRALLPKVVFDSHEPLRESLDDGAGRPDHARRARFLLAGLVVVLLGLAAAWRFTPLSSWADPATIGSLPDAVRSFAPPVLIASLGFVIGSALVVPITLLIALSALLYGWLWGALYSLLGIVLAGSLAFGVGAFLGRDVVRSLAGTRIARISRMLGQQGVMTLAALRLIPVAPFTIVNIVAGASHIRLRDFLLGSMLGMLPGVLFISFVTAGAGSLFGNDKLQGGALIGAAIGCLIVGVIVARAWRRQQHLLAD